MLFFVQGKKGKKAHYLGNLPLSLGKPGEAASASLLPGALGLQGNRQAEGRRALPPGRPRPGTQLGATHRLAGWTQLRNWSLCRGLASLPSFNLPQRIPQMSGLQNPASDLSFVWKPARVSSPKIDLSNKQHTNCHFIQ